MKEQPKWRKLSATQIEALRVVQVGGVFYCPGTRGQWGRFFGSRSDTCDILRDRGLIEAPPGMGMASDTACVPVSLTEAGRQALADNPAGP
jgi:hypothetical protein